MAGCRKLAPQVQFLPFPLDAERERRVIAMAQALAEQGQAQSLHLSLFALQSGRLPIAEWQQQAVGRGVDLAELERRLATLMVQEDSALMLAEAHGVRVVPTTFINGIRFEGLPAAASVQAVIEGELAKAEQTRTNAEVTKP